MEIQSTWNKILDFRRENDSSTIILRFKQSQKYLDRSTQKSCKDMNMNVVGILIGCLSV